MRQQQFQTKEAFIEDLTDYVVTDINGFNRDWIRRALNVRFGDMVLIETDGQELGTWNDPPRPEPGVPDEPSDDGEE